MGKKNFKHYIILLLICFLSYRIKFEILKNEYDFSDIITKVNNYTVMMEMTTFNDNNNNNTTTTSTTRNNPITGADTIFSRGKSSLFFHDNDNNDNNCYLFSKEAIQQNLQNAETILPRPWPQLDDRIQQAIRNGIIMGVEKYTQQPIHPCLHVPSLLDSTNNNKTRLGKCRAAKPHLATIVTAYYELPSKHSSSEYEGWFALMLRATDPMIIFTWVNSHHTDWVQFVKRHRRHAPTIIVNLSFANLTCSTRFSDSFWNSIAFPKDLTPRSLKSVDVYKIWNEKVIMVHEVAQVNPFHSHEFVWIDAGYYRAPIHNGYFPIVQNNLTKNGLPKNQVAFHLVVKPHSKYIAGGAWGGTKEGIMNLYNHYWKVFWFLAQNPSINIPEYGKLTTSIGFEQSIFMYLCKQFPNVCTIHKSIDWFSMGRVWLRNEKFQWDSSTTAITLDPPTVPFPTADDDNFPSFPTDLVLHDANKK